MFNAGEIIPSQKAKAKAVQHNVNLMGLISNYTNGYWDDMTEAEKLELTKNINNKRNIWARYKVNDVMFILDTNFNSNVTRIRILEEI